MKVILKDICKEFDHNLILKNINMELESGNIYGFIGRNGTGKSVLLKILCGFYKSTSGNILLDDVDITNSDDFLPDTRVLIENPNFLPEQTGFENLKILSLIQNKISDDIINKSLDDVNLSEEDRKKKYHKYSLGMKQKLGIAQVIMESPNIMIFDEPFNGIEEETVDKLKKLFLEFKKEGKIIIISSHIKEDIESLADVVYKFDNGTVIKK